MCENKYDAQTEKLSELRCHKYHDPQILEQCGAPAHSPPEPLPQLEGGHRGGKHTLMLYVPVKNI